MNWKLFKMRRLETLARVDQNGKWKYSCNGKFCHIKPMLHYGFCDSCQRAKNIRRNFYRLPYYLFIALITREDVAPQSEFTFEEYTPKMYLWK